jgi:hypothetical protein
VAHIHLSPAALHWDRYGFVKVETDRIADSLNALREQAFDWAHRTFPENHRTMDVQRA